MTLRCKGPESSGLLYGTLSLLQCNAVAEQSTSLADVAKLPACHGLNAQGTTCLTEAGAVQAWRLLPGLQGSWW